MPVRRFALAACTLDPRARGRIRALVAASVLAALMAGCNQEAKTESPQPRPVRTVTVEKGKIGDSVTLTGDIRAENEVNLAFRIGGRIIERKGEVGDKVEPDQVLAKLDPQDELNTLRSAQAALNAARGQEVEAENNFDRQNHLMERGFTTRANFDQAKQGLQTAQARVDDATAQLDIAQDRVGFTELKASVEGTITARSAESGQVVQAGQPIFTIARQDGRDAVFDVPAQVLRDAPPDALITVALANDPSVTAKARVRTVAPQADPVTRTFQIRLSLIDHPEAMRLGATVTGRLQLEGGAGISIPASALTSIDRQPAVWVVDPANLTVALRNVEVQRFDPGSAVISQGLAPGDVVVTAGVQALHPGQKVRLLGATS
jgi:membrane fusion protein, multidrug efflux system